MMKHSIAITGVAIFLLTACIKDDYFSYSDFANIKSIEVANQASQALIDTQNREVVIEFPAGVEVSALALQSLTLSTFATSDKKVGDLLDMTDTAQILVSSESGKEVSWDIIPFTASESPQLQNNNFTDWYLTAGNYYEPGLNSETTIWGTGNPGTQTLGLLATTPLELEDENIAVNMETLDNGRIPALAGMPISAGSVFTGIFDPNKIDPTNPEAAIEFGTPFAARPTSFSFEYSYEPGAVNKDKQGNVLSYGDACDIYLLLEIREGQNVKRLATAWFRSDESQADMSDREVELVYGPLDPSFPEYMLAENGQYISADSAQFVLPTHIIVVATSSCEGAKFTGAIGSSLVFDNLELIY